MPSLARRLLCEEHGQTTLEYALIAGSLGFGLLVAIKALGSAFGAAFTHQATGLMRAR